MSATVIYLPIYYVVGDDKLQCLAEPVEKYSSVMCNNVFRCVTTRKCSTTTAAIALEWQMRRARKTQQITSRLDEPVALACVRRLHSHFVPYSEEMDAR